MLYERCWCQVIKSEDMSKTSEAITMTIDTWSWSFEPITIFDACRNMPSYHAEQKTIFTGSKHVTRRPSELMSLEARRNYHTYSYSSSITMPSCHHAILRWKVLYMVICNVPFPYTLGAVSMHSRRRMRMKMHPYKWTWSIWHLVSGIVYRLWALMTARSVALAMGNEMAAFIWRSINSDATFRRNSDDVTIRFRWRGLAAGLWLLGLGVLASGFWLLAPWALADGSWVLSPELWPDEEAKKAAILLVQ